MGKFLYFLVFMAAISVWPMLAHAQTTTAPDYNALEQQIQATQQAIAQNQAALWKLALLRQEQQSLYMNMNLVKSMLDSELQIKKLSQPAQQTIKQYLISLQKIQRAENLQTQYVCQAEDLCQNAVQKEKHNLDVLYLEEQSEQVQAIEQIEAGGSI